MAVEMVDELLDHGFIGIAVVGQLQTDEGIADGTAAHVDGLAVEIGTPTLPGIETLIGTHLIDHTQQDLTALCQGDGYGIGRKAMNEIRGAVERIDHPKHLLVAMRCQSLLGDEARLGQQLLQRLDNHALGGLVDIRHIVVGVLALHLIDAETRAFLLDIGPCLAGYTANGSGELF